MLHKRHQREAPGAIAVFGDGIVALLSGCTLARALPHTQITLIAGPSHSYDHASLADLAHTAQPSLRELHDYIGLDESDMIRRAGASHRLGSEFSHWRQDGHRSVIAHGAAMMLASQAGAEVGTITPSIGAALAGKGVFATPSDHPASPLSEIDYALRFSPDAYCQGLRSIASRLGVNIQAGEPQEITRNEAGILQDIGLRDGRKIAADIFIDATGPARRLVSLAQNSPWLDWSAHLPGNRLLLGDARAAPHLSPTDQIEALNGGWLWRSPGRDGTRAGLVYNSAITDDAHAQEILHHKTGLSGTALSIEAGRLENAFTGNLLALGDAAAQFEPLHWCNLHLVVRSLQLWLELLPSMPIEPLEQSEFNRRWALLADRTRDFVAAHYAAPTAFDTPFWREAAQGVHSPQLQLTLSQFAKHGRLPAFDEESLPSDLWRQLMWGLGLPYSTPAKIAAMPSGAYDTALAQEVTKQAWAVKTALPYDRWLARHLQQ